MKVEIAHKRFFFFATLFIAGLIFLIACKKNDTAPAGTSTSTTGSNNNGSSSGNYGSGKGKCTFWTSANVPGGIDITINGTIQHLGYYFPNGTPDCDNSQAAGFILPTGSYSFTAVQTGGSTRWSGSFTIAEGSCITMKLNYDGSSSGSTTGSTTSSTTGSTTSSTTGSTTSSTGTTTGPSSSNVCFWTSYDHQAGYISIYVNGTYRGQITSYYSGGFPGCNASGCVTVSISGTNNTWYAKASNGTTWPANGTGAITVPSGGCGGMQLN